MRFTQKISLLGVCGLMVCLSSIITQAAEQPQNQDQDITVSSDTTEKAIVNEPVFKQYLINVEAKCGKKSGLVYCVDLDGNPITGQVTKIKNGVSIRRYNFQEGYLNGLSEICDDFGNLSETRPYVNGVLNGTLVQYDREGQPLAQIPYVNGKKEGIATYFGDKTITKMVYIDDVANGDMVIYDKSLVEFEVIAEIINNEKIIKKNNIIFNDILKNKNKDSVIYRIKNSAGKMIEGTYYYLECPENQDTCVPKIVQTEIPAKILKGINNGCLEIQNQLTDNPSPFLRKSPSCDEDNTKQITTNQEVESKAEENSAMEPQVKTEVVDTTKTLLNNNCVKYCGEGYFYDRKGDKNNGAELVCTKYPLKCGYGCTHGWNFRYLVGGTNYTCQEAQQQG